MRNQVHGQRRQLHGGSVARALRLMALSLILAVLAAFAAHYAESAVGASHADVPSQHAVASIDGAPISDEAPTQVTVAFVGEPDVLRIAGLGCAALIICGLLGTLMRSSGLTASAFPSVVREPRFVVAPTGRLLSHLPATPSPIQLSISRT